MGAWFWCSLVHRCSCPVVFVLPCMGSVLVAMLHLVSCPLILLFPCLCVLLFSCSSLFLSPCPSTLPCLQHTSLACGPSCPSFFLSSQLVISTRPLHGARFGCNVARWRVCKLTSRHIWCHVPLVFHQIVHSDVIMFPWSLIIFSFVLLYLLSFFSSNRYRVPLFFCPLSSCPRLSSCHMFPLSSCSSVICLLVLLSSCHMFPLSSPLSSCSSVFCVLDLVLMSYLYIIISPLLLSCRLVLLFSGSWVDILLSIVVFVLSFYSSLAWGPFWVQCCTCSLVLVFSCSLVCVFSCSLVHRFSSPLVLLFILVISTRPLHGTRFWCKVACRRLWLTKTPKTYKKTLKLTKKNKTLTKKL